MLRMYSEVLRGFRRRAAVGILAFVASGLAESIGVAALLPFLQGSLKREGTFGNASWFGLEGRGLAAASLVVLVVLGVLAAGLRYLADVRVYRLQTAVDASLRARITAAFFRMRWTAYLRLSLGEATKAVLVEGGEVGRGVQGFVSGVGNLIVAVAFLAVAVAISVPMTLAILAFGGFVILVYRAVGRRAETTAQSLSSQLTELTELATDLFGNAKFYRSTGRRDSALEDANRIYARWEQDYYRVLRYQPITRISFDVGGIVFLSAILGISLFIAGASAAEALVLVALFYRLGPKLQLAQQGLLTARAQAPWWASWKERFDEAVREAEERGGDIVLDRNPEIAAERVTFAFPGHETPVLSSVGWTLPAGGCLAIVGESGSGKTTMLDLVTGVLQPTAGNVRLDGIDLEQIELEAWRGRIGLVMQDAPLFFASILENIAWGDPEPDRTKAMRCAELAHIAEFIESLPQGLVTQVGHRGGRVSGGQRQRIALARALYRDPWLLVLDEATSALDSDSEHAIQNALRTLKGSCSILMVAHRIKTVEMADHVLVLARGRLIEEGRWDDLVARPGGEFRRMALAQGIATPEYSVAEPMTRD